VAEGVFLDLIARAGLSGRVAADSAGTGSWHVGEPPHERTRAVARERGIELQSRARQVTASDLERFDYVIAMDASNVDALASLPPGSASVHRLRDFDPQAGEELDVPDPYYGGPDGFELVHDVVERSCAGLLEFLRERHGL